MTTQWKPAEHGKALFLGRWKVGSVFYDACRPKGNTECYGTACLLPGMKARQGNYKTEAEGMARIEKVTEQWIREAATPHAYSARLMRKTTQVPPPVGSG